MLFSDINFLLFLVPLLATLWIHEKLKWGGVFLRNTILLIASYWFYAQLSPTYVVLLGAITLLNWISGKSLLQQKRKWVCGTTVILSLLPLICYKYAHFFIVDVLGLANENFATWVLPIGISFFTFQALTYTIDIYRGKIKEKAPLIDFMLFVSFFPNILSGPIEKGRNLLPQLHKLHPITNDNLLRGSELFAWGLFKKVVVADRIAIYTNSVFEHPDFYSGNSNLLAIALYSIQIYCDFSGYTDMAIGVAKMMGFRLNDNFRFPYFSTTIRQFWKKWHISLTSWFTEYLYIACGGNRVPKWRWYINISLVFLVSGLWHGAAWTFIFWGALHAVLYLIEHISGLKNQFLSFWRIWVQGIYVYIVVSLAWVFYRANTFNDATAMINGVFRDWGRQYTTASLMGFVLMLAALALFIILEILAYKKVITITESENNPYDGKNLAFLVITLLSISLLGQSGAQFVYFKF